MDNNPHVLAALGAGSIGHLLPSRTVSASHGIIDDNDTNIRTFPVLDAIVSLSVADASAQVVAVALQVAFVKPKVVLPVAGNGPVKPEVLAHITHMWGLLTSISNRYDNLRRGGPAATDLTPVNRGIDPWRTDFVESVYRYSILKILKRFDKWWGKLVKFIKQFVEA